MIEATLLVPLSIATAWTQMATQKAVDHEHWYAIGRFRVYIRRTALVTTGVISIMLMGEKAAEDGGTFAFGDTAEENRDQPILFDEVMNDLGH